MLGHMSFIIKADNYILCTPVTSRLNRGLAMKYKKEERLRLDIDRQIYDGEITRHQAAVFDIGRNDGQQFPLARIPPGTAV